MLLQPPQGAAYALRDFKIITMGLIPLTVKHVMETEQPAMIHSLQVVQAA